MESIDHILDLIKSYQALPLSDVIDYNKFNHYAITHHSTAIEGSTLNEMETRLLLEEHITPKGKQLTESMMTLDHYQALLFILNEATHKTAVTEFFLKAINAHVLKNTGAVYNTALGTINSSVGEYRLSNVRAGHRYFANYAKVQDLTAQLCKNIHEQMMTVLPIESRLFLAFDAHFDLVRIHPWYYGNGRTSRLLMNFIQACFDLPLSIVYKEDKADYFNALEASRDLESKNPFRDFMMRQYRIFLQKEIESYRSI
jgi:Fic family protein